MNNKTPENYSHLSSLLWQFHSLLNTTWPKPGEPALDGASVFIGTTLFKSLENGLPLVQEALEITDESALREDLKRFWTAFNTLFLTIGKQDRNKKSEQVDFSFNLLYLASGVAYHRVTEMSCEIPKVDERLIGVEPFYELLKLCRWPDKAENVKSVFESLIHEMTRCAQDLK